MRAMNTVKKASKTKGFSIRRLDRTETDSVLWSKALKRLPRLIFSRTRLVGGGQISAFQGIGKPQAFDIIAEIQVLSSSVS